MVRCILICCFKLRRVDGGFTDFPQTFQISPRNNYMTYLVNPYIISLYNSILLLFHNTYDLGKFHHDLPLTEPWNHG